MKPDHEAKRFFVDRVIRQAATESVILSEAERAMLLWSESDLELDPEVMDRALGMNEELSDEEYEAKVSGLLERAFSADVGADAEALDRWRRHVRVLNEGDHYMALLIDQAVGRRLNPWWRFWS